MPLPAQTEPLSRKATIDKESAQDLDHDLESHYPGPNLHHIQSNRTVMFGFSEATSRAETQKKINKYIAKKKERISVTVSLYSQVL